MNVSAPFAHLALALVLIVVYLVLTLTGHDTDPVLGILAGQGFGGGIQVLSGAKGQSG